MQRKFGRWLIEFDPDATRKCFAQLPPGTGCSCNQCRNFDAAIGRTFPSGFYKLADTLGVDPTKSTELCHYYREPSGNFLTGGWFHLVGAIVDGEDAWRWVDNHATFHPEEVIPGMEFGFSRRTLMVADAFNGLPLIQLDFSTHVPWILPEPAPE